MSKKRGDAIKADKEDSGLREAFMMNAGQIYWHLSQDLDRKLSGLLKTGEENERSIALAAATGEEIQWHRANVHVLSVACAVAVMQAFSLELFMKAALARGEMKFSTHDLGHLWEALGSEDKAGCETDFEVRLSAIKRAGHTLSPSGIRKVSYFLGEHRKDFQSFRYGEDNEGKTEKRFEPKDRMQMRVLCFAFAHVLGWGRDPLHPDGADDAAEEMIKDFSSDEDIRRTRGIVYGSSIYRAWEHSFRNR